jgi:putative phosphoesterase
MKAALLGDIHGNSAALDAVLGAAKVEGVEHLIVTGDLIGYYRDAQGVLERLRDWPMTCVRGNHEDMVEAAAVDPAVRERVRRKYGGGVDAALALPETDRAWLRALPVTASVELNGLRVLVAHGAPWDTDQYIYPNADDALVARLDDYPEDIIVLGHTHWRKVWTRGGKSIVNPGSVGQPRDRIPGAAWALLDTETGKADLRTESYDIERFRRETAAQEPDLPYLSEVLVRT